jgi:GT2 family glycosyltransferase/2-polyprenyl-3-methyl-5-hydroxy-6-metoxy-1,4-benzoquinol methylase
MTAMELRRIALIFDTTLRPETAGVYCHRSLERFVEVEHFQPHELERIPRQGFDLYLNIDDGLRYHLPPECRPSAFWAIDTHLDFDRCRERAPRFDVVFAAQRDGVELLRGIGVSNVSWLPLACDPDVHRKHDDVAKQYDVAFVGNIFPGPRGDLLGLIQRRYRNSFIGQCYFDDMARTYSSARVAFNRSIRNDVNMRVFEAVACGSMLLTNDLNENGLGELFRDGVHLATYREPEDLLDKLAYYLEREPLRERIAAAGRAEAIAKHTYGIRMETLLRRAEEVLSRTVVQPAALNGNARPFGAGLPTTPPPGPEATPRARAAAAPNSLVPPGPGEVQSKIENPRSKIPDPDPFYFGYSRPEVVAIVPDTGRRVLDIGCGAGRLGEAIKQRQQAHVSGIEFDARASDAARQRLDQVWAGDVERLDLQIPPGSFDAIVCADILEHLREPGKLLEQARRWLAPGGCVVASIPNVRHHSVVRSLLQGNWTYESAGLLDRTHMRFFTRREIEKLFHRAGFLIEGMWSVNGPGDDPARRNGSSGPVRLGRLSIDGLAQADADEFYTYQFLIRAQPLQVPDYGLTSIVIITYNQVEYTRQCLDSIRLLTDEPFELIVVDNGSTDGTLEFLRALSDVRVIENGTNRGFPAAVNQGIAVAAGKQVLPLNNDVLVTTGWLGRILRALHSDRKVGLVGPRSNFVSGPQQIEAGYENFAELDGFAWDWGKAQAGLMIDVHRLVGFWLLIRREVIDAIGVFDEQFGVGCFEDDDYCLRALAAGYRAVIAGDAFVHHYGCRTFLGTGVDAGALMRENQRRFLKKWSGNGSGGDPHPAFGHPLPAYRARVEGRPRRVGPGPFAIDIAPEGGLRLRLDGAEYLRRSIAQSRPVDSHLRKAYALLVFAEMRLGRLDHSLAACAEGRRLFPEDVELQFREGVLMQELGRPAEARAAYLRVLNNRDERHLSSVDRGLTGFKARHLRDNWVRDDRWKRYGMLPAWPGRRRRLPGAFPELHVQNNDFFIRVRGVERMRFCRTLRFFRLLDWPIHLRRPRRIERRRGAAHFTVHNRQLSPIRPVELVGRHIWGVSFLQSRWGCCRSFRVWGLDMDSLFGSFLSGHWPVLGRACDGAGLSGAWACQLSVVGGQLLETGASGRSLPLWPPPASSDSDGTTLVEHDAAPRGWTPSQFNGSDVLVLHGDTALAERKASKAEVDGRKCLWSKVASRIYKTKSGKTRGR